MADYVQTTGQGSANAETGEMELREHMGATVQRTGAKEVTITEQFKNSRHGKREAGPFTDFDDFVSYWRECLQVGDDGKLFSETPEDDEESSQQLTVSAGDED